MFKVEDSVHMRVNLADYTRTIHSLWGGTKFGFDTHALMRSKTRFYKFMSYELLLQGLLDILRAGGEELEEHLLDLPFGSKFVVYNEADGLVIFAGITYNEKLGLNECFIYSIYYFDGQLRKDFIYVEEENKGLYKVCKDQSLLENPSEIRYRTKRKH